MSKTVIIPDFTPKNEEPADVNFHLRVPKSLRARIDRVKQASRVREINRYYLSVITAATAAIEEQLRAS